MNPRSKFLWRWAVRLFALALVLIIAAFLLLDVIARKYAEYQIHRQTGLVASIASVHIGIFHPGFTVKQFELYNSAAFGGSPLIDLPELQIEYDLRALLAGKLHARRIRFNLAQLNIVQDKTGRRNLDEVERQLEKSAGSNRKKPKPDHSQPGGQLQFAGIDELELTLGTARFVKLGEPARTNEFVLHVDHQVFRHIASPDDLAGVVLAALLQSGANILTSADGGPGLLQLLAPQK